MMLGQKREKGMNEFWKSLPHDVALYLAKSTPPVTSPWFGKRTHQVRMLPTDVKVAEVIEYRTDEDGWHYEAWCAGADVRSFKAKDEASAKAWCDERLREAGYLLDSVGKPKQGKLKISVDWEET